jgi:acetyl-CoA acetyltransferase
MLKGLQRSGSRAAPNPKTEGTHGSVTTGTPVALIAKTAMKSYSITEQVMTAVAADSHEGGDASVERTSPQEIAAIAQEEKA